MRNHTPLVYFLTDITMNTLVKIGIWIVAVALILGAAGFAWSKYEDMRTQKAIESINATKITMDDVMGKNLPPKPDQALSDSTIAGIDANNNLVRDDVELSIFEQYPDSARVRAAMLQYAQALQLELTQVFNSDVYIATIIKEDNGSLCIVQNTKNAEAPKNIDKIFLNTDLRIKKWETNAEKYLKTYLVDTGTRCDIAASLLPN